MISYQMQNETPRNDEDNSVLGVKTRVLRPDQFGDKHISSFCFPGKIDDLINLEEDEVLVYSDLLVTPKLNVFLNDGNLKNKRIVKSQRYPFLGLFGLANYGNTHCLIHLILLDKLYKKVDGGYVRQYKLVKDEAVLMKPPTNEAPLTGGAVGSQISNIKRNYEDDEVLTQQNPGSKGDKFQGNSAQRLTKMMIESELEEQFTKPISLVDEIINDLGSAMQIPTTISSSSLTRRQENQFVGLMMSFADVSASERRSNTDFNRICYDIFNNGNKRYYSSLLSDQKMCETFDRVLGRNLSYIDFLILFQSDPKGSEGKLLVELLEYVAPILKGQGSVDTPTVVGMFKPYPIINFLFGMTTKKDGTQFGFLISLLYHLSTLDRAKSAAYKVFDLCDEGCNHSLQTRYCQLGITVDKKRLTSNSMLEVNVDFLECLDLLGDGRLRA